MHVADLAEGLLGCLGPEDNDDEDFPSLTGAFADRTAGARGAVPRRLAPDGETAWSDQPEGSPTPGAESLEGERAPPTGLLSVSL